MYKIYFLLIAYELLYFINNIIFIEFFYSLTKMEIKKKRRKIKKKKLILFFNFSLFMT